MELTAKTNAEIETWVRNHENAGKTATPLYRDLLEERVRRTQLTHKLNFDLSLEHLKLAAIQQICTSYGALAAASSVELSVARHQMNGTNGHLDRLLDICYSRGYPLLTAICVNQGNIADGELGDEALVGFAAAGQRLGLAVDDPIEFHHRCRDECWK